MIAEIGLSPLQNAKSGIPCCGMPACSNAQNAWFRFGARLIENYILQRLRWALARTLRALSIKTSVAPSKVSVIPLSGALFGKVPNSSNEEFAFENPAYRMTLPLVVVPNAAVGMSIWTSANPLPGFTSVIRMSWAPRLQANKVNVGAVVAPTTD